MAWATADSIIQLFQCDNIATTRCCRVIGACIACKCKWGICEAAKIVLTSYEGDILAQENNECQKPKSFALLLSSSSYSSAVKGTHLYYSVQVVDIQKFIGVTLSFCFMMPVVFAFFKIRWLLVVFWCEYRIVTRGTGSVT